jgi:hypothetical protein
MSSAARNALPAIQVWLHGAPVAHLHAAVASLRTERHHLNAQLVPQHSRVGEERLSAPERVQVGAADADAMHAHERVTGTW